MDKVGVSYMPAPGAVKLAEPENRAADRARAAPPGLRLSQRVLQLQQTVPFLLVMVVMFYEVTRHLLLHNEDNPSLLAIEIIIFGLMGPAVLWGILNWIGREIRAREAAESERDLRTAMLMEVHHRIKNNLQTVADLLSLEMARADRRTADESLRDSVVRIKSIAAAHELLSLDQMGAANVTELSERVAENARAAQVRPGQSIAIAVEGPPVLLPSKAATAFALVMNELVSNAIEHGFAARAAGQIDISLSPEPDGLVVVRVHDDGGGLAPGFDLGSDAGLGLRIVRTLVEKDLGGTLRFFQNGGACAEFTFPLAEGMQP